MQNQELDQLENEYREILEENEWKENDRALQLKLQYRRINKIVREECLECEKLAEIDCQFH